MYRIHANTESGLAANWATAAATFTASVDRAGASDNNVFNAAALILVTGNAANDGSNYFTPTWQDSDNGSTWAETTDVIENFPAALNHASTHDNKVYTSEYTGKKRYFQLTMTATSSPSTPCCVVSVLQNAEREPVNTE